MSNVNAKLIIQRKLVIPTPQSSGDSESIIRQLDLALFSVGFKLSAAAMSRLSSIHPVEAKNLADTTLEAVRELVGDHVNHNVYFKEFPKNIPDTKEFWFECIAIALQDPDSRDRVIEGMSVGKLNLLDLPTYGKYQHSYEEMLAVHDELIPKSGMKLKILNDGLSLPIEINRLYRELAGSAVPLNDSDIELLKELAEINLNDVQPDSFPIRENKAIINQVRFDNGRNFLADTVVDILRVACLFSDGDVTLEKDTRFSLTRKQRRAIMDGLNAVVRGGKGKLSDVNNYSEQFKRLGEHVHPHEYDTPNAHKVFEIARKSKPPKTIMARAEEAFKQEDYRKAIDVLSMAPGLLIRSYDRILRNGNDKDITYLKQVSKKLLGRVSGRVLLSLREHVMNRLKSEAGRVFANTKGTAFVLPDERKPLTEKEVKTVCDLVDAEIKRRLPSLNLILDNNIEDVALPLSNKQTAEGYTIMPRGSLMPVKDGILRFFMYWKESKLTTDYDLSAHLLDEDFQLVEQISYTNLRDIAGTALHSGDLTESHNGASEFIDINLDKIKAKYLVPQVNLYSGEGFDEVEESFFGFMSRTEDQKGKPFEPSTVQAKSAIRDKGRVVLPLVFIRDEFGWKAKWVNLFLKGEPRYNQVEANRISTSLIIKGIVEREYLMADYLIGLLCEKAKEMVTATELDLLNKRKKYTYIGLEQPEGLPESTEIITLNNLSNLIPE